MAASPRQDNPGKKSLNAESGSRILEKMLSVMDIERLGDLYFELSNEDRLGILHRFRDTSMNVTRLARDLEITAQECSRHMARLSEAILVARNPEGAYSLTPYDRLSLNLIAAQSFVAENRDYFNAHSIDTHPRELVARIVELGAGKTTGNAMVTFSIVENIMRDAKDYLVMIHDQYLPSILPLCVTALKRGITMRSVELKAKPPAGASTRYAPITYPSRTRSTLSSSGTRGGFTPSSPRRSTSSSTPTKRRPSSRSPSARAASTAPAYPATTRASTSTA